MEGRGLRRQARILVVDDEESMRYLLETALEDEGYMVSTASGGQEALEALEFEPFDLALIDLRMPGKIDGLQLMKEARRLAPEVVIIILTAYASLESAIEAVRQGAFDYIIKPVELAQLSLAVKRALQKKEAEEEIRRLLISEKRARQLADSLAEVSRLINSILDLDKVLEMILEQVERFVPYDSASIWLISDRTATVAAARGFSGMEGVIGARLFLDEGTLNYHVLLSKRPFIVEDVRQAEGWQDDVPGCERVRAWMGVPLIVRDEVIGMLTLDKYEPGFYRQEDAELALAFANQVATAIENARLYGNIQVRVRELTLLSEVGRTVTSTLDLECILALFMENVTKGLEVEAASIALLDEEMGELVFTVAAGGGAAEVKKLRLKMGQGVAGWVAQEGRPLIVPDVQKDSRFYPGVDQITGFTTRSILCAPLKSRDRVLGVIEAMNKIGGSFDGNDLRLLESLAAFVIIAIENARLYQEQKEAASQLAIKNKELLETRDRLIKAERLAAIGQIGVTISHEINNPLTAVLGNADWLLTTQKELPPQVREALRDIYKGSIRIRDIIKKLQDIKEDRIVKYMEGIEMIELK